MANKQANKRPKLSCTLGGTAYYAGGPRAESALTIHTPTGQEQVPWWLVPTAWMPVRAHQGQQNAICLNLRPLLACSK